MDERGEEREHEQLFVGTDDSDHNIVLGMPALEDMGVALIPRGQRWRYEHNSLSFNFVSAERFMGTLKKAERQGMYAHAVWIVPGAPKGSRQHKIARIAALLTGSSKKGLGRLREQFADVFEQPANPMPCEGVAHKIETNADPPHGPIYNLSAKELEALSEYLDDAIRRGWIRHSTSPAGAPILFVPKKDGRLRLCVDYRGLNRVTVKNRLALPLISEILDRVSGATVFSKIDLKDAYYRIPVVVTDRWKTAFRMRYGHFEYNVMPFRLTNAPVTFQGYINKALAGLVDVCCVVYLDNILIYSANEDDHVEHLKLVLERLQKFALYANEDKCEFFTDDVEYLGFRIGAEGVRMDPERIETVS